MENVKIHTLLIANRGEIACRIQRTAHEMGIRTVAVYAQGDVNAPFVKQADVAIPLRGRTSAESYLDAAQIIEACRVSGANAVHPGYGFLSENAGFAQAVEDAGLIWVGPSPRVISQMADKLTAKRLMEKAGVPVLQSIEIKENSDYQEAASALGYPLLVKASAGGGGRGMRVVEDEASLNEAVASAKREAKAAFGDETVFLEPWLTATRHIEIQILGDTQGNVVHCFERECSIQRRYQKIIEEAPSASLSEKLRQEMTTTAVLAAKSIGYFSTGTVEFIVSGDAFYFLEVNTRLQVEHPVTEEILGLDLVREQIRVAQGETLGFVQADLKTNGHAIEARLYAEDPANNFLPSPGLLALWEPSMSGGVRVDSGVEAGCEIGIEFDPMIAKVIVHAPTRAEASARLARVLEKTRLQGLSTNKEFLIETLRTPEFLAADTTTDFIERVKPKRKTEHALATLHHAAIAAVVELRARRQQQAKVLATIPRGWRNSKMPMDITQFYAEKSHEISVGYQRLRNGELAFEVDEKSYLVTVYDAGKGSVDMLIDGARYFIDLTQHQRHWYVHSVEGSIELQEIERFKPSSATNKEDDLTAPMPSLVRKVAVKVGDIVSKDQTLVVLESMKMELKITAPRSGIVAEVKVKQGCNINTGEIMVSLEENCIEAGANKNLLVGNGSDTSALDQSSPALSDA